jgi:uncharacterized membrane protein
MGYHELMFLHLATVVPSFFIGTALLFMKKGTNIHKKLGRVYMVLMLLTAFTTLFMPAHVGPRLINHFGWIHSFSLLTIVSVPRAYYTAKIGNIKSHKIAMISLYFGAIIIAGGFTFLPGRYLHSLFFGA